MDYSKLENYSKEDVDVMNADIEDFLENSKEKNLKEAVAYFYLLCSKLEGEIEEGKYPKYNGEKLDPISTFKLEKIKKSILGYFSMQTNETKEISQSNKETIAHNIAFILLTDLK